MKEEIQRLLSEAITIEPKACLNYLRKDVGCRDCMDACPTEAIYIQNQIPKIQHSKCVDCGACVSVCSVLAIDHEHKPYFEVKKQMEQYSQVQITCQWMESYQKGIKIPCYLYLDLPLLLVYGKDKKSIRFTIEPCQHCGRVDRLEVENHFRQLQEEIKTYGLPLSLEVTLDPLNDINDEIVEGITRRDLFKKISIKNIREVLLPSEEVYQEKSPIDKNTILGKSMYKRELFHQFVLPRVNGNGHKKTILPEKSFSKIELKDSCKGCTICENICPTQALFWENTDHESRLLFFPDKCISCKNCLICPEGSIQFETILLEEYVHRQPISLVRFNRKICIECGDEFRTTGAEETCSFCNAKNERDPMQFFDF